MRSADILGIISLKFEAPPEYTDEFDILKVKTYNSGRVAP
jgi:hypothetical protein